MDQLLNRRHIFSIVLRFSYCTFTLDLGLLHICFGLRKGQFWCTYQQLRWQGQDWSQRPSSHRLGGVPTTWLISKRVGQALHQTTKEMSAEPTIRARDNLNFPHVLLTVVNRLRFHNSNPNLEFDLNTFAFPQSVHLQAYAEHAPVILHFIHLVCWPKKANY